MTRRSSQRARAREIYREMAEERAAEAATPTPDPSPSSILPKSDKSDFGGGGEQAAAGGGEKSGLTAQNLTEKVRALYEHSAVPVAEIAAVAGVTERTIYKYARKHRWKKRYRWLARNDAPRGRGWRQRAGCAPDFIPVRGAGGRFVRRADKGKPFAAGLKATDAAAAARAAAACRRAAGLSRAAQRRAAAEQRDEARLRALETVNRALADLNRYRAARAKAGQPALRDDDRVAQLLVRMVEITTERWQWLLTEAGAASCLPSPLVGEGAFAEAKPSEGG